MSKSEVLEMYGGSHIPLRVTEQSFSHHDCDMVQFLDLFSIPEATLFADVMEVRLSTTCACTCSHMCCLIATYMYRYAY